jgi:YbbR domain-containing protein
MAERVPIRVTPEAGLIITNADSISPTASLQLRAQQSMRQLIAAEDFVVWADLTGLGPGEYTIPLQYRVAPERRATVVGITPRQITVQLEVEQSKLVPVTAIVTDDPALAFALEGVEFDARQVTVSGPESRVTQVVEAQVQLNLAEERVAFEDDVRLIPVDADGNVVEDVVLAPSSVHAVVGIEPRSDVREVRVQPNIVGELPEGYILTGQFDYDPSVVVVSGPAELLNDLPGTFFTAPIDLSDHTSSFSVSVPVELPDPSLVVIQGGVIDVQVGITAQTVTSQFDRVDVDVIGERANLQYQLATDEVTVLVTGPQPALSLLDARDVSVIVDVSGLGVPGTYQLTPTASIGQGQSMVSISLLPAQIDVEITSAAATAEATDDQD